MSILKKIEKYILDVNTEGMEKYIYNKRNDIFGSFLWKNRISSLNDNNDVHFVKRSYYWEIRKCLKKQEIRKYMRKYFKELFEKDYKIKLIIRLENDEFFFFISFQIFSHYEMWNLIDKYIPLYE